MNIFRLINYLNSASKPGLIGSMTAIAKPDRRET
jgi:hypothetical protein